MTRVIKFRVWHKPTGRMHDYLKAKFGQHGMNITLSGKFRDVEEPTTLTVPNKDLVVMQFTGLLDKNGKEIYEGDLCRISTFQIGEIFFDDGRFQVRYAIDSSTASVNAYYIKLNSYEVIGNICQNPELVNP
jgi:uncharacterized phage protein (TIGR01671 family)